MHELVLKKTEEVSRKASTAIAEKGEALVKELTDNFPEYAREEHIYCTGWKYDEDVFTFQVENLETQEHEEKVISSKDLSKVFPLFFMSVVAGELDVSGIDLENIWDAGSWDADALDCMLQLYFYGELVFG